MPQDLPIIFPLGGLDESLAADAQPPMTTAEFTNVCTTDPTNGRKRGAKRAGHRKFVATAIGTGPVVDLATVTYDERSTTYAAVGAPSGGSSGAEPLIDLEVVWKAAIPAGVESQRVAVDRYGNVYCLNGPTGISKFNSSGVLLSTVEVPVQHPDHRLLSIAVDDAFGIYTGVQYGPQGSRAQVFKYRDSADGNLELQWILDTEGFVPDLKVSRGLMFVLENRAAQATASGVPDPTVGTAHVSVYDSLDATEPRLLWTRAVPYPASQLAVNASGSIFVACAPNSRRAETFTSIYSTCSIEWTPELLVNYSTRAWAWLDASDLEDMAEGDEVTFWRDKTGNGRNLFHWGPGQPVFNGIDPPTYKMNGLCDKPTVLFAGHNGLATQDTSKTDAENQLTSNLSLMPTVNDQRFTIFMVIAPRKGGTERGCVLEQWGEVKYRLVTNENDTIDGTVTPGALRLAISPVTDGGGGTAAEVDTGSFVDETETTYRNDVAIVVFRMGGDDASNGSYWRINGTQIDAFTINRDQIRYQTQIGFALQQAGLGTSNPVPDNYQGEVAEIITILDTGGTPGVDEINSTEIEQIEGYLAHKYGIQHQLPAGSGGHPYAATPPPLPSGGSSIDPPPEPGGAYGEVLKSPYGIALKLGPNNGGVRWAYAGAGVGYAINIDHPEASDPDGVYNVGPVITAPSPDADATTVRKLTDGGTTVASAWAIDSTDYPEIDYFVRLEVDRAKNVYLGHHTVIPTHSLYKVDSTGAIEWIWDSDEGDPIRVMYDVALDPNIPDYQDDTIKEPEFAYVVGYYWGSETLFKVRLVTATPNEGSPRATVYLAVADGNIRKVIPNPQSPDVEVATVTGGSAALNDGSPWIQSVTLFGEVFFIDGEKELVYNPKTNTVAAWVPTSPGEAPRRPRVLGQWRSRKLTARFADEPQNWFFCAVDDPYNVDLAPPGDFDPGQAVIGNDSRAGVCPDIINAFIPATDDFAFFGGDHTIHRMAGDPMAGGVFEIVSSKIGMAYGRPWCQDERGNIYFAGSVGGIWVMGPAGGEPKDISDPKVYDRLREVDFGEYTFRLAWDADAGGLLVLFVPLTGVPGTAPTHYFWERDTDTWQELTLANSDHEPTSVLEIDGDLVDDRRVLIGCADGYIRTRDHETLTDDGEAIASQVLIGPIVQPGRTDKLRATRLRVVLAKEQGPCRYELVATDSPQERPEAGTDAGILLPGTNTILARAAGRALWLRLMDASTTSRWAFESATVTVTEAGRAKG